MSYFELHARSAYSFLRGASTPLDLAKAAAHAKLPGLALLDRDGVYGAPQLYSVSRDNGLRPLVGIELTMEDSSVVPLLAATRTGYQNLCRLVSETKLSERLVTPENVAFDLDPRERKRPCIASWSEMEALSEGLIAFSTS